MTSSEDNKDDNDRNAGDPMDTDAAAAGANDDDDADDEALDVVARLIADGAVQRAVQRIRMCTGMLDIKPVVEFHIHCDPPNNTKDRLDFFVMEHIAREERLPMVASSKPDGSQFTFTFYKSWAEARAQTRA